MKDVIFSLSFYQSDVERRNRKCLGVERERRREIDTHGSLTEYSRVNKKKKDETGRAGTSERGPHEKLLLHRVRLLPSFPIPMYYVHASIRITLCECIKA